MKQEIGPQYPNDKLTDNTGFLEKARLHQSKYRAFILKTPYDEYGNYLTEEAAQKGLNFYDDFEIFHEVKKRYKKKYSKPLYANMLRSEHIAFNLFIPLKRELELAKSVFNDLLSGQIKSIDRIKIEHAPSPSKDYLNDKTSFDTYIEYTHKDDQKGIIGIEVKYTEHGYALKSGSKQEKDIKNEKSAYYKVSEQCGLYKENTRELLISDRFRQIWRNQLLGESIIIKDHENYKYFTSITIFPEGNQYFIETSKEYIKMLKANHDNFVPVTYEDFIKTCQKHISDNRFEKWLEYLKERYIVDNG
jgi:hypothetical protein